MRDFALDNLTDIVLRERETKTLSPPEGRASAGARLDVWQTAATAPARTKLK